MMRGVAIQPRPLASIFIAMMFMSISLQFYMNDDINPVEKTIDEIQILPSNHIEAWDIYEQPWPQFGGVPSHNGPIPLHSPDGGPGDGSVDDVETLKSVTTPVINWQAFESNEADSYGSVIGDFSSSITAPAEAKERCGNNSLFPVIVSSDDSSGSIISTLSILSGDDARIAWEVEIGQTREIRATPIIHDINDDMKPEIIVAYDTESAFHIDVWSPELTCSNSAWEESGHSNELVWSYSDSDVRISSRLPHFPTRNTGHFAVTQPLLADLDLDGTPNLILALVDDPDNNPVPELTTFDLTMNAPTTPKWSVSLDRGTHPSDPVFAQLDSTNSVVLLTTIDSSSGNMWIWKVDGPSGSILWERVAVQGTDTGDDEAPRLRLPGPVIVQLDGDAAPEMVLTVPTDPTGQTSGTGAKYIGMEITSTDEIFSFRSPNGYADVQPVAIDTDDDGIHDRLCWVTWYREGIDPSNREGLLGCHDISNENPSQEWTRNLQRGGGNGNDEIAVSPPFWMDINGDEYPEILVGFGKRIYAFDGDTGASADVSDGWSTPLGMPHRTWAAPAIADVDGDGSLDILMGDTLVSEAIVDLEPTSDGRGISFNPNQPNPGDLVTITGQFSNVGTDDPDENVDVMLLVNGIEVSRERFADVVPAAPTGNGGPLTITATITAELGIHSVELILDIYNNVSEAREDNNHAIRNLNVVEPYVAQFLGPENPPRIVPGQSDAVEIGLMSVGSQVEDWSLSWDSTNLPEGWTFDPVSTSTPTYLLDYMTPLYVEFQISIPETALGDEQGFVHFTLTLDSNQNITHEYNLQIEVFRTRGISLLGPSGVQFSTGQGILGGQAQAWMLIENIGNAQETTTTLDWTTTSWGETPTLRNHEGSEIFNVQLEPGERQELLAEVEVPSSASVGDSTSTELTICIGSGEDLTCASISITFEVKQFVVTPNHQRTLPNATLQWNIVGTMPSNDDVIWNMASASMLNSGWEWSSNGDLTTSSTTMTFSGNVGEAVAGQLTLNLPEYTPPMRHNFDGNANGTPLNFSLQVLQQFRSEIQILSPSDSSISDPYIYTVSETHRILLGINNPGNGEDTYELSSVVENAEGENIDEFVQIDFLTPLKMIDARSSGVVSVDIMIGNQLPALETLHLTFRSTSLGDLSQSAVSTLYVQPAPNREWTIELDGEYNRSIQPSETDSVVFDAKNIGNAYDVLTTTSSLTYNYVGDDTNEWFVQDGTTSIVQVNQSSPIYVNVSSHSMAHAGTDIIIQIEFKSDEILVYTTTIRYVVLQKSGWKFNLTGMDLEVEPNGSNVTLQVDNLGNSPETPYIYKFSSGWNITIQNISDVVQPFDSTQIQVFVTPPPQSFAGEIEEILLQISDNDGQGSTIESIPFRVAAKPNVTLDARGHWKISEEGGYPAAWITNNGNDIAQISIDISGLPADWNILGPLQMTLSPNEMRGLQIELLPPSDWNGFEFLAQIRIQHPDLEPETRSILVKQSNITWKSSPVVSNYESLESIIALNTQEDLVLLSSLEGVNLMSENDAYLISIEHGSSQGQITLNFEETNQISNLTMFVDTWLYPEVESNCQFANEFFTALNSGRINGTVASCTFVNNDETDQRISVLLVDQFGNEYKLQESMYSIEMNSSLSRNITILESDFDKGIFEFELKIIDQLGKTIEVEAIEAIVRPTGWNIGIQSFQANGDLQIGILRPGYEILEDEYCILQLESEDGWSFKKYVDITSSAYAPIIIISDPGELKNDEKITATLSCDSPYDRDDNPDDNVKSTFYKSTEENTLTSSNLIWVVSTASILFIIAWMIGFVGPKSTTRPAMAATQANQRQQKSESIEKETTKEIDDLSIEIIEEVKETGDVDMFAHSTDDFLNDMLVEHSEETESSEQDASDRLDFIRQEMEQVKGESREGSIEDRMKKFFDGK